MDHTYTVYYEYFEDDDAEGYNVVFPAIPEIVTWGATIDEAKQNAKRPWTAISKASSKTATHYQAMSK